MEPSPDSKGAKIAAAEHDLARITGQVESMRSVLVRLLQDVVVAEKRLGNSELSQLVEANEQLLVSALRDQTDTENAVLALTEASRNAELDPLTQLPNRVLLLDRFALAMTMARRRSARLAVLFVDIDEFKQINDALGHAVGDEVLKHVAHCLTGSVREADTVSRQGGDEFVILLTEVSQPGDAVRVAEKLIAALGTPKLIGGHVMQLKASVGISVYPDHGDEAETLVEMADAAMYRAKRQGHGGYMVHGQAPSGNEPVAARAPAGPAPFVSTTHEQLHVRLQEANEHLVLATINAQELQAGAERARQRQGEFMAVVAHELRNPRAPIRVATAMLGRTDVDEVLLPRIQLIIDAQVAQISRLVADMIDVSNAGNATSTVQHRPVELAAVIDTAVDTCRPTMDGRRQQFGLHIPLRPIEVQGDAAGLMQLVSNLLDNASKYTPDGGRIGLSVVVSGGSAVMTVSDNGIGITVQALPHVFEPFAQDIHAIGLNGVGPGIGLTAVRELVRAHGGTVLASSAGIGLGSQFTVTLPLIAPADAAR